MKALVISVCIAILFTAVMWFVPMPSFRISIPQSENVLWIAMWACIVGGAGLAVYARVKTGRWW